MAVLNDGKDAAVAALIGLVDTVRVGTSTAAVAESDIALGTEVANKAASVDVTGTGEWRATCRLSVADNNGSTLTEAGSTLNGTLFSRQVHAGLAKTALIEVQYELIYRLVNVT